MDIHFEITEHGKTVAVNVKGINKSELIDVMKAVQRPTKSDVADIFLDVFNLSSIHPYFRHDD
jgi:hypothetical protein